MQYTGLARQRNLVIKTRQEENMLAVTAPRVIRELQAEIAAEKQAPYIANDAGAREYREERNKAVRDYVSAVNYLNSLGDNRGQKWMALTMLRKGESISDIVEFTGLDAIDIARLILLNDIDGYDDDIKALLSDKK